jgi:myosin heavy subunit
MYIKEKKTTSTKFTVKHYAGPITYDVASWIEKNRDTLTPSVLSLLRESGNTLVRELFSTSQTNTGGLRSDESQDVLDRRQEDAHELIQVRVSPSCSSSIFTCFVLLSHAHCFSRLCA